MKPIEIRDWYPAAAAVAIERWDPPAGDAAVSLLVQHLMDPFTARLPDDGEATLQAFAHAYLERLLALDGLPALRNDDLAAWTKALAPGASPGWFGWMPFDAKAPDQAPQPTVEPAGSRRLGPADRGGPVAIFASQRLTPGLFLGSGFGLRIVLRLRPLGDGRQEGAVLSLAASLPFGPWAGLVEERAVSVLEKFRSERQWLSPQLAEAAALSGMRRGSLRLRGLRLGREGERILVQRRFTGQEPEADDPPPDTEPPPRPGRLSWFLTFDGGIDEIGRLVHRAPVYAAMADGEARVFVQDPASLGGSGAARLEGPRRDAATLDGWRVDESIQATRTGPLRDPLPPEVVIRPCPRFASDDAGLNAALPRPVTLPGSGGPPVRSDDASAVQAFRHLRDMLGRMRAYGIDLTAYFQLAHAHVDVFYRSGISPGPGKDGQAVNARVLPEGWPTDFFRVKAPADLPKVQLHLGVGDRARRDRLPRAPGDPPARARSLGIAADARWMWHEFAHVLLVAATSELELRFAHSPGDALAAIAADPESRLSQAGPRWRFVSFPWVMLSRRHDRSVARGWGWNGRFQASVAALPDSAHPRYKGYAGEQILSSTLFRLYRCLGGDTELMPDGSGPDRLQRRRASHYSLYLVMQAIHLLGDARVLPASRPEAFEAALALADTARADPWEIVDPVDPAVSHRRVPGCAHKLVRWAFEAQGLHTAPGGDVNAPGAPLPVDVYIADGRPDREPDPYGEVVYAPGHYLPVSLHWQDAPAAPVPAWQAQAQALVVRADGSVEVRVGNRGQQAALGVGVEAWWAPWPTGQDAPLWNDGTWAACTGAPAAQDIPAGGSAVFTGLDHPPPAGRYLLLARASCAADRSNLDATPALACSLEPTRLDDLVAGDNNLALRVVWA